jgi:hypothetical protein
MAKPNTSSTSKKTTRRLVANKTATASATVAAEITDEQIAERAFHIYLQQGCPEGRHLDHWFQAVSEFRV